MFKILSIIIISNLVNATNEKTKNFYNNRYYKVNEETRKNLTKEHSENEIIEFEIATNDYLHSLHQKKKLEELLEKTKTLSPNSLTTICEINILTIQYNNVIYKIPKLHTNLDNLVQKFNIETIYDPYSRPKSIQEILNTIHNQSKIKKTINQIYSKEYQKTIDLLNILNLKKEQIYFSNKTEANNLQQIINKSSKIIFKQKQQLKKLQDPSNLTTINITLSQEIDFLTKTIQIYKIIS